MTPSRKTGNGSVMMCNECKHRRGVGGWGDEDKEATRSGILMKSRRFRESACMRSGRGRCVFESRETTSLYSMSYTRVCYLCAVRRAVLNDPLQLLVDELHAAQARLLQSLDLPLHQQLEAHLRNEQRWTRPLRNGPPCYPACIGTVTPALIIFL